MSKEKSRLTGDISSLIRQYKKVTGSNKLIGFDMVNGLPDCVVDYGGAEKVYADCIKKRITWQELLDYHEPEYDDDVVI